VFPSSTSDSSLKHGVAAEARPFKAHDIRDHNDSDWKRKILDTLDIVEALTARENELTIYLGSNETEPPLKPRVLWPMELTLSIKYAQSE
jgi:hypothetical protein